MSEADPPLTEDRTAELRKHIGGRLLVIGHSASRSGSPKVLLGIVRWLAENTNFEITMVLGEGGPLVAEFERYVSKVKITHEPRFRRFGDLVDKAAGVAHLPGLGRVSRRTLARRGKVSTAGYSLTYANSASALRVIKVGEAASPVIVHVHELEFGVKFSLASEVLAQLPDRYIAVSRPVRQMLIDEYGTDPAIIDVIPGCLPDASADRDLQERGVARRELGWESEIPVVLGCGKLSWQKGFDIFLATAAKATRLAPEQRIRWCWVGGDDPMERLQAELEVSKAGLDHTVELIPEKPDPSPYFDAADLLLLSSKEDSYPLVVLEAALAARPVVCQSAEAGGAADFVSRGAGIVVPFLDLDGLALAVLEIIRDPSQAAEMGRVGRRLVLDEHLVSKVAPKVLSVLERSLAEARN